MRKRFRTFIDAETTGLSRTHADIIEFALIRCDYDSLAPVGKYWWFVKTQTECHEKALEAHGITPEMYANAITQREFYRELHSILKPDELIIGHNIESFDCKFLSRYGYSFKNETEDTLKMCRAELSLKACIKKKTLKSNAQINVCKHFGLDEVGDPHRALYDALLNRKLYARLKGIEIE